MSNLTLLPLIRVSDGVQTDEDWRLSIAFFLDDGVTPIPLDGLTFTLQVGSFATISTSSGQISIGGPSDNVLGITVLAENKSTWPTGVFPLTLSATDGVATQDLFANSTLTVGSAQIERVTLLTAPDSSPRSVASSLPAALGQAFQALQPASMATALANVPSAQLTALAQALLASLAVQTGSGAPVNAGQAFINSSGFVVIAQ